MRFARWVVISVAFLGLAAPRAVTAQTLPGEQHYAADLSLEYNYAKVTNSGGPGMPIGAAAALGYNVSDSLAIAGDVRWNRKTDSGITFTLMSFQGGPRLVFRGEGATPYVQALAGVTRTSAGVTESGLSLSASETKFSVMPGAGVDIKLTEQLSFRLGADFRLIFTEGEKERDILAHAGIVLRFGRR
jgi:opacity protein-like surface antigen